MVIPMHPDHERDLERIVGRALGDLPMPRAPRTLLPRVLAAAARRAPRPWYTRAWLTWPRGWQVASVSGLAIVAAGVALLSPHAQEAIDALAFTAAIARVLWSALLLSIAVLGFVLALGIALAGGACWNVINRLTITPEGPVHP